MTFSRFIATIVLLQGVVPWLLFGALQPGGWLLVVFALIASLLSWGLWRAWRWAATLAFLFTLLQFPIISSQGLSWQFYAGASAGFGVAPAATFLGMPFFWYRSVGMRIDMAWGRAPMLMVQYAGTHQQSFVLFNLLVVPLLSLLAVRLGIQVWSFLSTQSPNHALPPTAEEALTLPSKLDCSPGGD